ncbi:MAG: hypothetical protein EA408_01200 [Marinilabiliales bacterium]|nr:MAG: hypothetical protein EA408_01200 [Marinilabiliales bacterium]
MIKKKKLKGDIETSGLLLFVWQRRIPLIAITALALVASVIVSLLITPRYSSSVILYPTPMTTLSRSLLGPGTSRDELMTFGREADGERILQILQSNAIRDRVIEKYNLMEHYGINWEGRFPITALHKQFERNVRFRKTQYMAIEIEVRDADPQIAAEMANEIAGYIDSVMNLMTRDRAISSLAIIEDEYRSLNREIASVEDSLRKIRELGILDYESQSEVYTHAYATAVRMRDTASIEFFRQRIDRLTRYGGISLVLTEHQKNLTTRLGELSDAVAEARIDAERTLPYKYVVNEAFAAEKKSYPVRSLIVAVSTISAFLLTLFGLIFADSFRKQVLMRKRK